MALDGYRITSTYDAHTVGLADLTIASQRTSNALSCDGYNQVVFYVDLTWVAATRIDCVPEVSPDGTKWARVTSESIAAGIGTNSNYESRHAVTASDIYAVPVPCNSAQKVRLKIIGQGATTDTVRVSATLGAL